MKKEAIKLSGKTKKEPPVLWTGQEIEQLEYRRIELRNKKRGHRESGVYRADLWKRSADEDREWNEQIILKLYFKVVEDESRYTKEDLR